MRPGNPESLRRQNGKERKNWLVSVGDGRLKLFLFNLFYSLHIVATPEGQSPHPL